MAVRTISTRLAIEGDAEYRSKLTSISSSLGALDAKVKLVNAQYQNQQNTTEALTAKSAALAELQSKQAERVKTLEAALNNARAAQERYTAAQQSTQRAIDANNAALDALGTGARKNGNQWNEYADQVDEAEKQLQELRASSEDTTDQEAELEAQIAATKAKMAELDTATNGTARQAGELLRSQSQLKSELRETGAYQDAATRGVNGYEKQLSSAKIALANTNAALERNDQYLQEAKESADGCAKSIDAFGREARQAGEEAGNAFSGLSEALAAAGIVRAVESITDAMEECTEASSDFGYSMAKVETLADTSSAAWATMGDEILDLSLDYGRAATDLGEAAYQALSASVDTASAVDFLQTATELSIGGYTSASSAVDILTTSLNSYGLAADQAAHVSDVLITTQNLGKTSVDQLAQNMGRAIPTAGAYNVSLENLSTSYALLTKNGIATAESTTYISGMLKELGDSGSSVSETLQTQTGKSFSDLSAAGWSLGDVMESLLQAVNGDLTAFSNLWSSAEAGKAAIKLAQIGAEEYNRTLGQMTNSAGATTAAYQIMAATTQASGERMETAAQAMKIAVGNALEPALISLQKTATGAFTWIADVVTESPELVSTLGGVTVTVGTLAAGITALAAAQKIASAASNVWKSALAAMVTPAGAVTMTLTALIAVVGGAAVAASNYTSELNEMCKETANLISAAKDSASAYDNLRKSNEDAYQQNEDMLAMLVQLSQKEQKSASDKAQILNLVDALNEAVPELNLAYDEQADILSLTSREIEKYLQSARKQAELQTQMERMNELLTERQQLEGQLATAQQAYNDAVASGDTAAAGQLEGYNMSAARAQTQVDNLTRALEENEAEYDSICDAIDAAAEATDDSAESNEAAAESAEVVTEAISELQEAYEEVRDAARDSLESQYDAWDKVEEGATMSSKQIIEALDSQTQHWKDYDTNLAKVLNSGVDGIQDFVKSFADGSAESASYLASLASLSDSELSKVVDAWRDAQSAQESAADSIAELSPEYEAAMQEAADAVNNSGLPEAMESTSVGAMEAGIEGIQRKAPELQSTAAAAAKGAYQAHADWLSSGKAKAVTVGFLDGGISGINSKSGSLTTQLSAAGKAAYQAHADWLTSGKGKSVAQGFLEGGISGVDSKSSSFRGKVSSAGSNAAAAFKAYIKNSTGYSAGSNLIQGAISGSNDKAPSLKAAASSIGNAFLTQLKKVWGIASPSKETRKLFGYLADGFTLEADRRIGDFSGSAKRVATAFTDSFRGGLSAAASVPELAIPNIDQIGSAGDSGGVDLLRQIRDALAAGGQEITINVPLEVSGDVIGRASIRYINKETDRTGICPIKV